MLLVYAFGLVLWTLYLFCTIQKFWGCTGITSKADFMGVFLLLYGYTVVSDLVNVVHYFCWRGE